MVMYSYKCRRTGLSFRAKLSHAASHRLEPWPPTGEDMCVFYDAQGRMIGGGQLVSELIDLKYIP